MLPYVKDGCVYFQKGILDIDNCNFGDVKMVLATPDIYQPWTEHVAKFVIPHELGEIEVFVDMVNDRVFELHLELFEDLAFADFVEHLGYRGSYHFFDYEQVTHVLFDLHFIATINPQNSKISRLIFLNSEYIKENQTDFAELVRQTSQKGTSVC